MRFLSRARARVRPSRASAAFRSFVRSLFSRCRDAAVGCIDKLAGARSSAAMSRSFGAILGVLGVLSCAGLRAQELTPGGPAKALAFAQCVHGKPVTGLAKGVVHLIHFWGEEPSAVFDVEDKFAALQKKFGDKLNILAVLHDSEDYSLAAVQDFYKEDAAKPTFPIACDVGGTLHQAWVAASGQEGRVAFVVDADGKLMWTDGIGFLDVVIDQVMTGKADAKALRDDTDAAKKLFMRVLLVASLKPAGA